MSRALFTKLPPFNSVFDEARVASTPTSVLKSVASAAVFATTAPSVTTAGLISWSTLSSNTQALTLSNSYYSNGSGLFGTPIGTLSLIDTSLYNPQSCVEVSSTTQTRFIVLQDGVFRVSGRAHILVSAGTGSLTGLANGTAPASLSVFLMRDDSVTLTEMNKVVIPAPAFVGNGVRVVVPWDTVRPFASGTVLNIGYAGYGSSAVGATVGSLSVALGSALDGAECHITREVTLVHAVPQ
jgi:hypothetical protein